MPNERDRTWALGALLVSCSLLGTSYGGHFAQPKKITEANIGQVLRTRKRSILQEFSKRLQVLLDEGKQHAYKITSMPGPWQQAVETTFDHYDKVFVYIDAPYKREEYSRYYHILETLVKYNYPRSEGKGLLSSKESGERFASEFFTKSTSRLHEAFRNMISTVIEKGWACAWSYSNNGAVSMVDLIQDINSSYDCDINIYHTPYYHMNHGRASKLGSRKSVTEYLIVFKPKTC
ncbi:MAG: DNA adenine methylase [Suipraeoptans sp.]